MADTPLQSASGTGIAQAYGDGAQAHVHVTNRYELRASLDDLRRLLQEEDAQSAQVQDLAAQLETSREAVLGFFRILKEQEVPLDQMQQKLMEVAQRHMELLARLRALEPDSTAAHALIEQARTLIAQASSPADYDQADGLLCQAEEANDPELARAEQIEREAHQAAVRMRRQKAATRAQRAELSLTRLDQLQAAQHFQAAASFIQQDDPIAGADYLLQSVAALRTHGAEKGEPGRLLQAAALSRTVIEQHPKPEQPLVWALAQHHLGLTLQALGGMGRDETAPYLESVAALRKALEVITRTFSAALWAGLQNDLGNSLCSLGEREKSSDRLREAVDAFDAALEVRVRESLPLQWAMTVSNRATALFYLGELDTGTATLLNAIAAAHEVLEVTPREGVPVRWAATQNNLGLMLYTLAGREHSRERMKQAITAFQSALEELPRDRMPHVWQNTHDRLQKAEIAFQSGTGLSMLEASGCSEEGSQQSAIAPEFH